MFLGVERGRAGPGACFFDNLAYHFSDDILPVGAGECAAPLERQLLKW